MHKIFVVQLISYDMLELSYMIMLRCNYVSPGIFLNNGLINNLRIY